MAVRTDRDHRMDVLSCRLILAYLESDPNIRAPYVDAVRIESGLSDDAFELANWTACNVAQIHRSPAARTRARKVMLEWLSNLVMA